VGTVVDLRSDLERREDPYELAGVRLVAAPLVEDWMVTRLMERFATGALDADEIDEWWRRDNASAPERHVRSFRSLFRALLEAPPGEAVLYHCRGGKDRTGVVSAVLLDALGVRREEIYDDFLLSNRMLRSSERAAEMAAEINRELGTSLTPDDVLVFAGVRREWLEATFSRLEERYGTAEAYVAGDLGLGRDGLRRLRSRLLADGPPHPAD
jgi:protein-tyrosine phosphatase